MTRNWCNQNQSPALKPKWEITKITKSQKTKRIRGKLNGQLRLSKKVATRLPKPTLTLCLPVTSAVNLGRQFGPRSGPTNQSPNCLTFWCYFWKNFFKKLILKKISRRQKSMKNYPVCNELILSRPIEGENSTKTRTNTSKHKEPIQKCRLGMVTNIKYYWWA